MFIRETWPYVQSREPGQGKIQLAVLANLNERDTWLGLFAIEDLANRRMSWLSAAFAGSR